MKTILFNLLLILAVPAFGQKYHIEGFIKDSFTKEGIDSAKITLMTMDSIEVEAFYGEPFGWWQVYRDIKAPGKYIMKFEHDGYYTAYRNVNFKYVKYRHTGDSFGEVLMHKMKMKKEVTLGEVKVTASKVKMVMRGDTIVYNADAFQLSSGSMLDKLIMMLPGVTLDTSGQIFVNGEKVEALLVNGENFFHGDPKVALDNLPYYMVDKVKAYRKTPERVLSDAEVDRMQKVKLPLVVDVGLKKEYSTSWVGNMVAGVGTDNHHEARMFVMRFTPNSHVAVIGNTNDVRGDSYYSSNGQWQGPQSNRGDITTQEVKIDGLLKSEKKTWKLSDNISFKTQKRNDVTKSSTTTFFADNVYSRAVSSSRNKNLNIGFSGSNSYKPSRNFSLEFTPRVSYTHYNNRSVGMSADFNHQLSERYLGEALDSLFGNGAATEYRNIMISSLRNNYYAKGDEFSSQGNLVGNVRLRQDMLRFSLYGTYNNKTARSLQDYERVENDNPMTRYKDMPQSSYRYNAKLSYDYVLSFSSGRIAIVPGYGYSQSYNSANNEHYILDGSDEAQWNIDRLHLNGNAINQYIDNYNSYTSRQWNKTNDFTLGIDISKYFNQKSDLTFSPSINVRRVYDKIAYERALTDTIIHRTRISVEPSFDARFDVNKDSLEYHWRFNYSLTQAAPSLIYSVNYRDDATPLVVRESGFNLPNSRLHWFMLSYRCSWFKKQRFLDANMSYALYDNTIRQSMTYNSMTGVRTYRPTTISGVWVIHWYAQYATPIDKKKMWRFTTQTSVYLRNDKDYLATADAVVPTLNAIKNWYVSKQLSLGYSRNFYSLNLSGKVVLNHTKSQNFSTSNAVDYQYGISGQMPLPMTLELFANLKMYSRRGYADSQFNTDQLIANIKLGRNILNGKMRVDFEVFDLFNKMSGYSYTINAQMQQETYTNLLRRYAMLSLTYKFSQKKKHTK